MLAHIEAGALLPPLVVLQTLAANPHLNLAVVKGYMARTLSAEGALCSCALKTLAHLTMASTCSASPKRVASSTSMRKP